MAAVGDRVQVPSKRVGQAPREGVVTGVSGGLLRVTWSGGEESTIIPSMGSLVVVGGEGSRQEASVSCAGCFQEGFLEEGLVQEGARSPTKAPTKKVAKAASKKAAEIWRRRRRPEVRRRPSGPGRRSRRSDREGRASDASDAGEPEAAARVELGRSDLGGLGVVPDEGGVLRRRRGAASPDAVCRCGR